MQPIAIGLYLILCTIAGLLGYNTRFGFWGWFILGFVLTPILVIFALLLFTREAKTGRATT